MTEFVIYVVDDEPTIREGVSSELEDDYQVFSFETAEDALEAFPENPPDLILLDIELPGMNGTEALPKFRALKADVLVIMITAYEDIKLVISSMKQGARDYIVKPLHMEALEVAVANALETIRLRKEIAALQEKQIRENLPCFIGESEAIHDIMDYIGMVAKSPDTPILILGDTGTGKELIAATIHHKSPNFEGPLVTVNCAAIPKDLLESELFGYEKGAFSGASATGKRGLIEAAHNGTLFLDEVGDLNPEAQAKLLRFMESGEFYKVGSTVKQTVKARIVSATNRDLDEMITNNTFRKDLYFRLGVVKIQVPSLNERKEDTILLARYFLQVFNEKFGKALTGIDERAVELLKLYVWSGNVRELKNMMERAVLTARGTELTPEDLGLEKIDRGRVMEGIDDKRFPPLPPTGIDITEVRLSLDRFYFGKAMEMAKGNETRAAKLLNLKHHTFRYQLKKISDA
ncbi:MAG TPA: sigma-54-dependent Fis family transcriptional regulator [Desulfobacteraceae bacterium]|nr:sigma-54-dependent Fis family transcriptional regulator [Desulfobacteraceae bacterium]|tara:strand:+ start:207 stop:1592 length:1386 start_codon:yes stop_codon:yes gene_type:complete